MEIKEYRTWSVEDVRAMCIRERLYTAGTGEEYRAMFRMVNELTPTDENIYRVAEDISRHCNFQTVTSIMYMLANDVVRRGFEIVEDAAPAGEGPERENSRKEEPMAENTFEAYKAELEHAGPRLKKLILHRAEQEGDITFEEFVELCRLAYPEE